MDLLGSGPPCYLRGFSELAMLWIMDRPTLVTGHSLPWLQSGCHTGQSGCVRSHASLLCAQGSDLPGASPQSGRAAGHRHKPYTTLVIAVTGPTDQAASRSDPRVCPAWRPSPCPSLLCHPCEGGVLPLPTRNIALSFPRVQDQRLLLCALPTRLAPASALHGRLWVPALALGPRMVRLPAHWGDRGHLQRPFPPKPVVLLEIHLSKCIA